LEVEITKTAKIDDIVLKLDLGVVVTLFKILNYEQKIGFGI
jgi:hypothetical protein